MTTTQTTLAEPIFEPAVRKPAGGRFKHLTVNGLVAKYKTDRCDLILNSLDEWFGCFNKTQLWFCNKHKLFFRNSVREVYYRDKNCPECLRENQLISILEQAKIEDNILVISTRWYGKLNRYLFFCTKHSRLCIARWCDIVNKKNKLVCCYSEEKWGKPGHKSVNDTIAMYMTIRG